MNLSNRVKDIRGERFGRLLVLSYLGSKGKGYSSYWQCLCDCGELKETRGSHLKNHCVSSCGCINRRTLEEKQETKKKKDTKYRKSDKGKLNRHVHLVLRKARNKKSPGTFSAQHLSWIRDYQGNMCAYCKVNLRNEGHLDHIKPLSKGGSNWPANLQYLCSRCNLKKGSKWPYSFKDETFA